MAETGGRKAAEWAGGVTSCDALPFRVMPHNVAAKQALLRARRRRRPLTSPLQRADLPRLLQDLNTKRISTPSHQKTNGPVPLGLGPDRVCSSVAWVSPLVSRTRKLQPRNGRTTLPDTAIARLKARGKFLAHEELEDDHTLVG